MDEVSPNLSRTFLNAGALRRAALAASLAALAFACEDTPVHEPFAPPSSEPIDSSVPSDTHASAHDVGSSQGTGTTQPPVSTPTPLTPSAGTVLTLLDAGAALQPGLPMVNMIGIVNLVDGGVTVYTDAGGSGISPECDAQIAKCNSVSPNLISDCVAVARHCNPVSNEVSPECKAQLDKCEAGPNALLDCPAVAAVCGTKPL